MEYVSLPSDDGIRGVVPLRMMEELLWEHSWKLPEYGCCGECGKIKGRTKGTDEENRIGCCRDAVRVRGVW